MAQGSIEHNIISRDRRLAISRPDQENLYNMFHLEETSLNRLAEEPVTILTSLQKSILGFNFPYYTR